MNLFTMGPVPARDHGPGCFSIVSDCREAQWGKGSYSIP